MHLPCPVPTIGLYDHHVQLSDHSICCECSRKCSPGHASTAHKRHFLGPVSAGLQPFVAAPRMVPAHVQSDSMMKDTRHQVSHYLKVSAALTQPSWTFLPESSPSHRFLLPETDNTVMYSIWYTDRWSAKKHHKSWLCSVGSILVSDPPTPQITTATTAAGSPRRKACPRHEEDMTILSVGLPLLDLLQARTCRTQSLINKINRDHIDWTVLRYIEIYKITLTIILNYIGIYWNTLKYVKLHWIILNYIGIILNYIKLI